MLHTRRRWAITDVTSADELARLLTEHTWTLCTGFAFRGYLFLNDSTSADAIQEYAVVKKDGPSREPRQVESWTVSWTKSREKAVAYIEEFVSGACDESAFAYAIPVAWEPSAAHDRCPHCA